MSKLKNCGTCKIKDWVNKRFWCVPCKRGEYVKDNWLKKVEVEE